MTGWQEDRARYEKLAWITQPSLWAIAIYRFGRHIDSYPIGIRTVAHVIYFAAYSIVRLITGIDIPRGARIGGGLLIHHFGGIVIHPQAVIGRLCTMRHGVTVGARDATGPPVIGDRVTLGAYAQVLGAIVLSDDCKVGAMAVVLRDVPRAATVVGNPAYLLNRPK